MMQRHSNVNGGVRDTKLNPVYRLLLDYKDMQEGEIICHISSWSFNIDGRTMFKQAKQAGIIKQTGNFGGWQLAG